MEAEDLLIQTLENFSLPVMRQGSMEEDENYPASFFTFWNNETVEEEHYNNKNHAEMARFDVNFYSDNPTEVYEKLREAKEELKAVGFTVTDSGHDVISDVATHIGRGIEVAILVKS